jgi:hypothetical protein
VKRSVNELQALCSGVLVSKDERPFLGRQGESVCLEERARDTNSDVHVPVQVAVGAIGHEASPTFSLFAVWGIPADCHTASADAYAEVVPKFVSIGNDGFVWMPFCKAAYALVQFGIDINAYESGGFVFHFGGSLP